MSFINVQNIRKQDITVNYDKITIISNDIKNKLISIISTCRNINRV